ncbi:GrpB family protein [Neobacillus sp. D3-1R]|uniref:GrpB family protein n=1 Tax=Neobacillus sp. D3-1R TaxID=3445778 RepID=UPI003F9FD5C6
MTQPMVHLETYNPNWELQFENEKARIMNVIGHRVIEIKHIGSTSIKELDAKPIIDIMVGVDDLNVLQELIIPLSEIEYEYVPKPELKDRRFFRKGEWGKGTCHLHLCEFNSTEWKDKLLFRNYLRLHPQAAREYSVLKRKLAARYQFDRPTYTKKKEPFIKAIIEKALKENLV